MSRSLENGRKREMLDMINPHEGGCGYTIAGDAGVEIEGRSVSSKLAKTEESGVCSNWQQLVSYQSGESLG